MKKNGPVLILLSCFILSFFSISKQGQWQGRTEIEDGVKVIENPQEPLFGEIEFELEEDLTISNEQVEDYMFYRIRGMAVNSDGDIFIADMTNFRVLVFDKNGTPRQTIGREGQGPGEFEMPVGLKLDRSTGDLYVGDRFGAIDVFLENGDVKGSVSSKMFIMDFCPLEDGTFWTLVRKTSDQELKSEHMICRINEKGEIMKTIAQFPHPSLMRRTASGATFGTSTGHELSAHIAAIDTDKYVYGYSKNYELDIINREGQLLYRIRKDAPKPRFTSEERDIYKDINFPVPEFKPYFYSLFTDSEGRIYVQCNKTVEGVRGYGPLDKIFKQVDIFNSDGYCLYKTTLPPNTQIIQDGYLYSQDLDEDAGIEYIRRFKIKNWTEIKDRI